MDKTILEQVKEAANKAKIKYVSFFNNGKIVKDNGRMERSFNKANDSYQSELLLETMVDGAKLYSSFYDFDSIDMHLILGLVFNEQDIKDDQQLEGAKPIKGLVRYYTGTFDITNGEEKTSFDDGRYYPSTQGFINYNKLMKAIEKSGLDYTGPETFQEFEEQILVGEPFDIKVSANLSKEEKTTGKVKVKTK